jgi:hypothetical protein
MKMRIRKEVFAVMLAATLFGMPILRTATTAAAPASTLAPKGYHTGAQSEPDGSLSMTTTVLRGGRLTKAIKKARTNTDVDSAWNYLTKRGFTPDVLNAKGAEFKLTDYVLGSGASEAAHERADKIMEEGGTLGNFIRIPFFNTLTNEGASVLYRTTTEGAFVGMEQWKQNKRNKVRLSDVVNKRVQEPALVTVNEDTTARVEFADGSSAVLGPHSHDMAEPQAASAGGITPQDLPAGCTEICGYATKWVCTQLCNWIWTTVCNTVCEWFCPICGPLCGWVCHAVQSWVCNQVCEPVTEWVCNIICDPGPGGGGPGGGGGDGGPGGGLPRDRIP